MHLEPWVIFQMAEEQLSIFQQTIEEQLSGPGSDVFDTGDKQYETITDFPLKRYYTGILFPRRTLETQGEKDAGEFGANDEENSPALFEESNGESPEQTEDGRGIEKDTKEDSQEETILSNHFYPSDMGISFCVDSSVSTLEVNFSFASYNQPKQTEVRIETPVTAYHALIDEKHGFPLKDLLHYEKTDEQKGYLSLKRELRGKKTRGRSGEYKQFDEWKKALGADAKAAVKPGYEQFNKLIGRLWRRKPIKITENVTVENVDVPKAFRDFNNAGWTLKTYQDGDRTYIKIQLINRFNAIPANQFSNAKEQLNQSCLFQSEISVKTDRLRSYKPYKPDKTYTDAEQKKLEFLYRKERHFAIGHNCSARWKSLKTPTEVGTTFLPTYDLRSTETKVEQLEHIPLQALSLWGKTQDEATGLLSGFVDQYRDWIDKQRQNEDAGSDTGKSIIADLNATLERLEEGVQLLRDDKRLFKAFQYANTAMLLQFFLEKSDAYRQIQGTDLALRLPCDDDSIEYRPFQLAFLLLSLESTVNPRSKYRKEAVDLIWFPTGGGKTEAYLAVVALTLIWRRMHNNNYQGVSAIMRYTLRLLTAQQFERASKLITTLDYLRQQFKDDLKDEPFSIGLWIGQSSTPNKFEDAKKITREITRKGESANQFQIDTCPWCGERLIKEKNGETYPHAFEVREKSKNLKIKCLNEDCHFHNGDGLPVRVVDETLYQHPPSLLFATVDKLAMLSWNEHGHKFFNSLDNKLLPPDLIIQDELHLLTGPLGSIAGLFETVLEDLCTKDNFSPKIIASTATTRNTQEQVKQLYGNREVIIFPPSGLTYGDSFFARQSENSRRRYLGFMPTGKTSVDSQILLLATLFIARLKVCSKYGEQAADPYWTLVSYYNSLKDIGRISNKVGDEIYHLVRQMQRRLKLGQYRFNYHALKSRTKELTSRIDSAKIKQNLNQLEQSLSLSDGENYQSVSEDVVYLVLATNMLSVGIDIARLNVMQINGMPRNTAEYIQASSRIGREDKGLALVCFDSNRARDKSYFEHFLSFHQTLYKRVEPLSVTPFTENTIDKMIASLMVTYIRHKTGLNKNGAVKDFKKEKIEGLKNLISSRFGEDESMGFCFTRLDKLAQDWEEKIQQEKPYKFYTGKQNALLSKPGSTDSLANKEWVVMQSMRDIDSDSFIQVLQNFK